MNINYKQAQFELFPKTAQDPHQPHKPRFFLSNITLSFENIIVLTVFLFMGIILSFSVGVERGKRLVSSENPSFKATLVAEKETKKEALKEIVIPEEIHETVTAKAETLEPVESQQGGLTRESLQKYFTIQVASFKTREHAEKEADILVKKGFESFVIPKGKYIIVCAGKFLTRDDAKNFSSQLKYKYKDCLIRSM